MHADIIRTLTPAVAYLVVLAILSLIGVLA
jgi:hypothetical protein